MLSMIVILFIISFLPLYLCKDWCEIIAPNQTYRGLGTMNTLFTMNTKSSVPDSTECITNRDCNGKSTSHLTEADTQ